MPFSGGEVSVLGPHGLSRPPWGSFAGKVGGLVWTSLGKFFLYTNAEWATSVVFQLEVTFRSTSGLVAMRLYDVTAAAPVSNSQLSTSSSNIARYRSSAFSMVDGNEYRIQTGVSSGAAGAVLGASLVGVSP